MKEEGKFRIYVALAVILGVLVLISMFLLFRKNMIDVPAAPVVKESRSIIDIPGIGEPSDPLEKQETEVDITVTPQYHGSFSWDKIGEWLEDPGELIDDTSLSIEGTVKFH